MLLLFWQAHLNILCIRSSYWSFYLLKFAMKCESHGKFNLNTKTCGMIRFLKCVHNTITINF
jgi:hypothetical protein